MSRIIQARNVNDAFVTGWWHLKTAGLMEDSRNGKVLVAPGMVITEYERPWERILFDARRDANPVFHLMEALWMLAGGSDVKFLEQFNPRMREYAERDGYIHGAYGRRWRHSFGVDQLRTVVLLLKNKPDTRQAVIQMWSPTSDLYGDWKDRPCNTAIYFDLRGDRLNMTVTCRSNDMLWGAYGANAVHFSVLQEVIACALDVPTGVYRQVSNNFHVYTENEMVQAFLDTPPGLDMNPYDEHILPYTPMLAPGERLEDLLADCEDLCLKNIRGSGGRTYFIREVAEPLHDAYLFRKGGVEWDVEDVADCDWKLAFQQWASRRQK